MALRRVVKIGKNKYKLKGKLGFWRGVGSLVDLEGDRGAIVGKYVKLGRGFDSDRIALGRDLHKTIRSIKVSPRGAILSKGGYGIKYPKIKT
jgi:hypothetical protein